MARPTYTEADLSEVIVTEKRIRARVASLGRELSLHYGDSPVTIVSILSGALVFTADLIRAVSFPTRLDCLRAESYGDAAEASQLPRIANPLKTDIENRHVLVVDDILDTGRTMRAILSFLSVAGPASLKTCVLLDKPARRAAPIEADFKGFAIPDAFVVGYGLDFAEQYRHLACIGVLKPELQAAAAHAVSA